MTPKRLLLARDFSLTLLSSFLLVLSFPDFNLGLMAWAGLLPLLLALNRKSLTHSFLLSLLCGMLFFMGIFHWILVVARYTLLHHALLALYLGSYFGFFGLAFSYVSSRSGTTPALLSAPFLWVSLEYVRSNLSFLALPWGLLGHSQHQYPIIIQIASLGGTYSISFLIVMVNAALMAVVYSFYEVLQLRQKYHVKIPPGLPLPKGGVTTLQKNGPTIPPFLKGDVGRFQISKKERMSLVIVAASLLFSALLYGYFTITNTITGNKFKISLVQGNIPQERKWDPRYAHEIMQIYTKLTERASKDQPDMIVWPETATPGSITIRPRLHMELIETVRRIGAYLLVGSAPGQKFEAQSPMKLRYTNSAFLIPPGPGTVRSQRYDKIRLFPFGEYLPYKETLPWSWINVRESSYYAAGKDFTVFDLSDARFSVVICWEDIFPDLVRQFVKRGAQFLVNLTNEAHFGKTAAPHQLVSISVFRAVENRVFVVRCANTGVSCIIDPYGRIVDRVKDEKGQDIFVRGTVTGWIIPMESNTIYTRYGDVLVWVAVLGTVGFLGVSILKRKN